MQPTSLETVAHVIQLALTPVFLLSGIASLLGVFSTRLGRVADQVDAVSARIEAMDDPALGLHHRQLAYLRRRSRALDAAVILGALAGAATCGAALTLFLGAIRNGGAAWLLFVLFGSAVLATMGALGCYCYEMLLASRGLRAKVQRHGGDPPAGN